MNKRSLILFLNFCFIITFVANSQNQKMNADSVYKIVEKSAEPVGGMQTLYKKIKNNYPTCLHKNAKKMGISPKYFFEFVIDENGKLMQNSFKTLRPEIYVSDDCVKTLENLFSSVKWIPATVKGKNVKQKITFPILIHLR